MIINNQLEELTHNSTSTTLQTDISKKKESTKHSILGYAENDEGSQEIKQQLKQGLNEDKKKKNKKKKNKKKNHGDISSQTNSQQPQQRGKNGVANSNDNFFDKTQSTVGYGEGATNVGEPFSARTLREDKEREFTPLKDKLGQSFFEDQDSSEDEGMPDYKIGGYHPVHVGEILLDRYVIIQKLGWGHFSTVWLTKDLKYNNYVAMKVQKSAQHYLEAAYDEVEILDQVANNWKTQEWKQSIEKFYENDPQLQASMKKYGMSGDTSHCVQLLNSFIHHGPNGKHFVMVFEILGVNFLEIIKRYDYKGVPLPLVRKLARQCLIGLDYLHRMCKIIHTDFKPENVVICLRDDEVKEIANTGQLTTSKLFNKSEHIKKLNMRVAGALTTSTKPGTQERKTEEDEAEKKKWDVNMDGLTAKQKKNLRKKLQRKRRKQQQNQESDEEEEDEKKDVEKAMQSDNVHQKNGIMNDISNEINNKDTKKKPVKKGSNGNIPNLPVSGLLLEEENEGSANLQQEQKTSRRGPKIDENVQVKICDMGNGCWTHHHFTPEIQTRQYRSPEVIIGADYNTSADVWSFACTIFEMVTGDFLFEPRKGANYDKDDDHLAQMMELLGRMPKNMALSGKNSKKFFDVKGHLKKISGLNYWPLRKVLMEKYRIKEEEAVALADFLTPMLEWYPEQRAPAQRMINHPWLQMSSNYDYKYSDREYEVMMLKKQLKEQVKGSTAPAKNLDESTHEMNELLESDEELNAADNELNKPLYDDGMSSADEDNDYDPDEMSLVDSDEERDVLRKMKANAAKINNSFTGPYPLDPTDFNHTDKGPNNQFQHLAASTELPSTKSKSSASQTAKPEDDSANNIVINNYSYHLIQDSVIIKRRHNEVVVEETNTDDLKIQTKEEIAQRKIYKAKRIVPTMINEEENTAEDSNNEGKDSKGLFKFALGQGLSTVSETTEKKLETKITFSFPKFYETKTEETKVNGIQVADSFMKCMKLNDERKFFVNKNLFENTIIQPMKPITFNMPSRQSTDGLSAPKANESLVSENPLNSIESIKLNRDAKKETESPLIKSLFDFKENEKYKQNLGEESKDPIKPSFNFDTKNLFGEPGSKERGITFKPIFNGENPFKNITGQSHLFTSGKSLFETSNLNPTGFQIKIPQYQPPKEDEDQLEPEEKEKVASNDKFEKLYQKQIERLKIIKGVSHPEKISSKKDLGYLSIEKMKEQTGNDGIYFLVFRNFLGVTQFQGLISKKISKVKEINEKPYRYKLKAAVLCKEYESKKYAEEHCVIKFSNDSDRKNFIKVFSEFATKSEQNAN